MKDTVATGSFGGTHLGLGAGGDVGPRRQRKGAGPNGGEQLILNLFRTTESVPKATGVTFSLHDLRATCATAFGSIHHDVHDNGTIQ